jgi:hypothetical protein
MTEFIIWVFAQWFSSKAIAQLAPPMSKKYCDQFRGESWRAPVGTLGGAAFRVAGVTTLGGYGALWDAELTWIWNLVWYWRFSGEVNVGCTYDCGCLLAADLMGAAGMTGASAFCKFLVKISAVANADIVSSPMVAKGISGCGCFKASVMSWAAMSNELHLGR